MKTILFFLAVVFAGITAGLFFSWSVSVMPGLRKLNDREFIASMQAMNRAIQNPLFFTCFFGAFILLLLSCFHFYESPPGMDYYLLIASTLFYMFGVLGITISGNVPLNEMLDKFQLTNASDEVARTIRTSFENRWNYLNNIRTIMSIGAFCLLVIRLVR